MKQLVNRKSGYVQASRQMTSLQRSAKLKPALCWVNTLHNRLFSEPPTVYWGKHVVLRHFRRSYLKANKVSKRVTGQGQLNMRIIFKSMLMLSTENCQN